MKRVRILAIISVVAMLLAFSGMAQAAQARGIRHIAETNFFTEHVGKYYYNFVGDVNVDYDKGAWASCGISNITNPPAYVPNGYVKISCYLYNAEGALVKSAASPYSGLGPRAENALIIETEVCNIPDDYYTSARVMIYNPDTGNYLTWNSINSPRLTYDPSFTDKAVVPTKSNASFPISSSSGWIPAIATNGQTGVIREADLFSDFPQSPTIASLMPTADRSINVYAPGSNAVIGQFIQTIS